MIEATPTGAPGEATRLAAAAVAGGAEVVFAFGGDGTLREAAAGLLGTDAALAPLPGGTVNVVALALGVPRNPLQAARALTAGRAIEMDIGRCGDEIFLMQASAGLDARVMARLPPHLKRRLGRAAVLWTGILQWSVYGYPEIELLADGRPARATFAAICNLPYYAGGLLLAPGASVSDGWLDLVLFRGHGRRRTLAFARDLVRGRHLDRGDVELRRVREVELLGPADLAVQIDGDPLPCRPPVTVSLARQRLRMLSPTAA